MSDIELHNELAGAWAASDTTLAAVAELARDGLPDVVAAASRRMASRRRGGGGSATEGVAVIRVVGPLMGSASWLSDAMNWATYEQIGNVLDQAVADPGVSSILLEMDSPGGPVAGLMELADRIYRAGQSKAILAHVNAQASSAAYVLVSQATEVWLTPSGEVGGLGVVRLHVDRSRQLEREGVKPTYLVTSRHKGELNPAQPLSDDSKSYALRELGVHHRALAQRIARGRGVSVADVELDFGQGRMLTARRALAAGMVDKVAPLGAALGHARRGQLKTQRAQLLAEFAATPPPRTERERQLELLRRELSR